MKMYAGSRGLGVFSEITNIQEAIAHLSNHSHIWFRANQGDAREAKVNGAVKLWKRNPDRFEAPIKYGMYEYDYMTENDATSGRLLKLVQEIGKDKDNVDGKRFCKRCGCAVGPIHFDRYGICGERKPSEDFNGQIFTPAIIRMNQNPDSPMEGDILTTDYQHFYQSGKLVFVTKDADWRKAMRNTDLTFAAIRIWHVPEHGEAKLVTLSA
jgi:hypothetical protein